MCDNPACLLASCQRVCRILWPNWLECWLATLSGLSTQVRIPVGLQVPGRYKCNNEDTTGDGYARVVNNRVLRYAASWLRAMQDIAGISKALSHSHVTWNVCVLRLSFHDDVIKWKHFPRYWPFVRGIHRSPVPGEFHKGQWRAPLMFSLISVWINGWVNNRVAGDLRPYRAHYDAIVMCRNINYHN